MSQQNDVLESMVLRITGKLESRQTQRSVENVVGVSRNVIERL